MSDENAPPPLSFLFPEHQEAIGGPRRIPAETPVKWIEDEDLRARVARYTDGEEWWMLGVCPCGCGHVIIQRTRDRHLALAPAEWPREWCEIIKTPDGEPSG